jgi:hypothetical protein
MRSTLTSYRWRYEKVNTVPNNARLRCASLKIPPNTLPAAIRKSFAQLSLLASQTMVCNWPKAADLGDADWGTSDVLPT